MEYNVNYAEYIFSPFNFFKKLQALDFELIDQIRKIISVLVVILLKRNPFGIFEWPFSTFTEKNDAIIPKFSPLSTLNNLPLSVKVKRTLMNDCLIS